MIDRSNIISVSLSDLTENDLFDIIYHTSTNWDDWEITDMDYTDRDCLRRDFETISQEFFARKRNQKSKK